MLAYTYVDKGKLELLDKPKPVLLDERDAITSEKQSRKKMQKVVK